MRKDYKYLIFDADHTLIDFDADERRAFYAAFAAAGVPVCEREVEACWRFSAENWRKLGLHEVHLPHVQEQFHRLYRVHVNEIVAYLDAEYGFNGNTQAAKQAFMRELCSASQAVEGAVGTVERLSHKYRICVATNGLAEMQYGRLAPFEPFLFRVFVSEEMNAIKPSGEYFNYLLKALGAKAQECLMIGDSLSSDMAGASAAGMDRVWFNRSRSALPRGVRVTAEIHKIAELVPLLEG